ncbi:NAD(P)-dependent oxidoreductase [Paractinoplanes durhamensis]|uniref:2-hydroxy-3-oxopropionate reductase n=1 Tax=Paractinoplanes durhamensis TaxID=113563 RepID=A0ABQ3YUR8_9ACTN|nr:NAD(P)-dependent oxidoreductase [Actinoplanes durhamensis]GIE01298.1 2-hydroxy-3-oxopropionate reductase [Actinoplanes durhamensis]
MRIGFVGLGKMGRPMAQRLVEAGYDLVVADSAPGATEGFTAADGFEDVDLLILMLPNSAVVEKVLDDLVPALRAGTLVADMSSSEPLRTRALAVRLAERGLRFVDAPVSGGVRGAVAGTLAVMTGGAEADLAAIRPVLDVLGRTVLHVGPVGSGHAAKALNNLVSAATLAVTVEALRVGAAFGIAPETMNAVLNSSSGRSNTSENKVAQFMLDGSFASGFALQLMAKDVRIAIDLARALEQRTELGDRAEEQWTRIAAEVTPQTDHTRMYELLGGPR